MMTPMTTTWMMKLVTMVIWTRRVKQILAIDNHEFFETSGLNPPEGLKGIGQGLMTYDLLGHQPKLQARLAVKS